MVVAWSNVNVLARLKPKRHSLQGPAHRHRVCASDLASRLPSKASITKAYVGKQFQNNLYSLQRPERLFQGIHIIFFKMTSESPDRRNHLFNSSMTIPSDSENYSANNELSPSPPSSSSSPLILYSPPTIWGLIRGAAINLLLPFVNGLMLGFGELLAHEAAFRLGWSGTKVCHLLRGYRIAIPGFYAGSQHWSMSPSFVAGIVGSSKMALVANSFSSVDISQRPSVKVYWTRHRDPR